MLDEVAARAAVQREEDAEQVGTRAPSAADMVQQYAADVCQTTGRDRVAPDDAEHMVVELQAARAARPDVSEHDRQVAQALLDDLQNAMGD